MLYVSERGAIMEDLTDFETVVFSSFSGLTILVAKIALFYEIIGGGC